MYKDVIDTQKGIAFMAGKKEIYIKIAHSFTKNSDAKVAELRRFMESGDYERLTIEFHGLKSSSASVGSTALPGMALALELAGKRGENDYISEKFEDFIGQYQDTCGAIKEAAARLQAGP